MAEDGAKKATKVAPEQELKSLSRASQQQDDQVSRKKSGLLVDGVSKQAGLQLVQAGARTPCPHTSASAVASCASSDVPAANSVTLSRAVDAQKRIAVAQSWPATNSGVTDASHVNTGMAQGGQAASLAVRTVRPTGHPTTPTKTVPLATSRQSPSQTRSPRPIAMKPPNVPVPPVSVRQLNLVSSATPSKAQVVPILNVIPSTQSSSTVTPITGIRTLSTGSGPHSSSSVVILAPQTSGAVTMLPAGTVVHTSPIKAANILETPKPAVKSTAPTLLATTSFAGSGSQAGGISLPPGVRHIVITPQQQQYLQRQGHQIATFITPQQLQQTSKAGISQKLPLLPKNTLAVPISQPSRTLVHIQPKPSQIVRGPGAVVQGSQNFTTATLISIAPQASPMLFSTVCYGKQTDRPTDRQTDGWIRVAVHSGICSLSLADWCAAYNPCSDCCWQQSCSFTNSYNSRRSNIRTKVRRTRCLQPSHSHTGCRCTRIPQDVSLLSGTTSMLDSACIVESTSHSVPDSHVTGLSQAAGFTRCLLKEGCLLKPIFLIVTVHQEYSSGKA